MKTDTLTTRLDDCGRLHVEVPIADGPQQVDVVIVVAPHQDRPQPPDWDALSGCLGLLALTEDPVAWQRALRGKGPG